MALHGLVKEVVPEISRLAVLWDPENDFSRLLTKSTQGDFVERAAAGLP